MRSRYWSSDVCSSDLKESYADWAVGEAEALAVQHGPIDIVGHDWGALIAQRVAMLRPDLIRSWAVSNAVIDPDYRGHRIARIWNTPILGELFMALSKPAARSEEHTSELQSLMRISYAVFCLKKKKTHKQSRR